MPELRKPDRDQTVPSSRHSRQDRPQEYLSPNEIGREVGVSGVAVKQWIYKRQLPATRLANGYWRVARKDLERFLRERSEGGRRRVLLVGRLANEFRSAFEEERWAVIAAVNPIDAVLRAIDARPSLAVIDVASLSEGGWVAAKRLRATRGTGRTPLLLLVPADAESDSTILDRSIDLGAQACLTLPVSPGTLIRTARELLGG